MNKIIKLTEIGKLLGNIVATKDGIGVVISVNTPFNGLYVSPDQAKITVWYGIHNPSEYISCEYSLDEARPLTL